MEIIDLSVLLDSETPVYPGDPKTKLETLTSVDNDGHFDTYISTVTHTGTHIDAPAHMIKDGKTLNEFPASHFVGRGIYIKVENKVFDLEKIKQAGIQEGDIVLFNTGMDKYYQEPIYFEDYPVLPEEVAQYLVTQKIKMVGLDTGSADIVEGFPVHRLLLGGDVLIIENMTNLSKLEGKDFQVCALPLKLNVDGAPTRAIAIVN